MEENNETLASSSKDEHYLMTLGALWIQELEPGINIKDRYRSRMLNIKI